MAVLKRHKNKFEWAIATMVSENEFVHEILLLLEKHASTDIPTMGVTVQEGRMHLVYNAEFFDSLEDPVLFWVFNHEIYHLVLHHCTKRAPTDRRECKLYNIAADLAANCLIKESLTCRRWPKACFPEKFGFETHLSMEQYVELLRKKYDEAKKKAEKNHKNKNDGDDENQGGGSPSENSDKNPSQPQDGDGSGGDEDDDGIPMPFDNHDGWKESEIAKEIIRNKIEEMSHKESCWGNMPGDAKAMILAAQKTEISWKKFLRSYIGLTVSSNPANTMKKPHRRYGYPFPGTKRLHNDRKLVAIDTSASVGDKQLSQFLAEINKLQKIHPVDLVLFDTQIQKGPVKFKRKEAKYDFSGRGGTDFQAVMDLAENSKYKTLIMLTDGEAAAVDKPRKVKDVIWVITKNGKCPVTWGKSVKMNLV